MTTKNRIKIVSIVSVILLIFGLACSQESKEKKAVKVYQVEIITEKKLPMSSGSGICDFKTGFVLIGDDTPFLYYMDSSGTLFDSLRLSYQTGYVPGERMDGKIKPDFEAVTRLNDEILLIMGSGSANPARDTAYLVDADQKLILGKRSMAPIFSNLAQQTQIENRHQLNIEGCSVAGTHLYWFSRGDFSGQNFIFETDLSQFITYFSGRQDSLPQFKTYPLELPGLEDHDRTFSAAYYDNHHQLFAFTASSEAHAFIRDGKVVDGEIKGTSVGFLPLKDLMNPHVVLQPIKKNGKIMPVKIEGLWPFQKIDKNTFLFYGVSDPDTGETYLYTLKISFAD